MSNHSNAWLEANQRYLSGSIELLYSELMLHATHYEPAEKEKAAAGIKAIKSDLDEIAASMKVPPAIENLVRLFGLSSFEKNIILYCALPELNSALHDKLLVATGNTNLSSPSFGSLLGVLPDAHWSALSPDAPLRFWRLIEVTKQALITRSPLKIDEYLLHYLTGLSFVHEKIREIASETNEVSVLVSSQQAVAESIVRTIAGHDKENSTYPVIHLSGPDLMGKKMVASKVCTGAGNILYRTNFYGLPASSKEAAELARLWSREATLQGFMLLIECSDMDMNDKPRINAVTVFMEQVQGLIFLISDQWTPELKRGKVMFDIAKPLPDEQALLWETITQGTNGMTRGLISEVVSQFDLSADIIQKAATDYLYEINGYNLSEKECQKKIWTACCKHTRPQVDELAQRIIPEAGWDDIVLPDAQRNMLQEIAVQVRHRNKVYHTWGFAGKSSRGLGISTLFAGESGTGKTMAAEVLANELGLDLYRIDLSKVVNKYIGETEKNLKKIFDAAEEGGAILLFDEADALFGKRSDVKDSHDRYSNIEVSYLLQRMEAYRGLAILTSNMKHALDKAFTRRIRFIIQFPFPDAVQRAEIWSKVFPAKTPRHGLDMEKLSKLTIAGGSIRNIAMNAAFFAADEDSPVQMAHIFRAARSEYEKTDKAFNSADLRLWQ
ncbi:MAG: ATP-binding protein [Bacteroidetes bacterium]|nr:ATP-binding protein [Bacteroidota bacterium]